MLAPSSLCAAPPPQLLGAMQAKRARAEPVGRLIIWLSVLAAVLPRVCGQGSQGGLQAGAPWPAQGHDVGHSGRSPFSMGACPYGVAVRWSYTTGNQVWSSPAIGADGTVYVGSGDRKAYAVNRSTGTLRWNYTTGGAVHSSPAIGADGTVYVGSLDYKVYALNSSTGTLRWNYTTGNVVYSSPAIGADGTVYVGSNDYKVYALNGTTGALCWNYTTGSFVYSAPAIGADGTVYVGSYDNKVYALNGSTGALRWNYTTGGDVFSSPAIGADGTVYVGSNDGKMYALNGSTGALRWNYTTGSMMQSSPAIGADGTVYMGLWNSKVYALNGSTGAVQWYYTTGNSVASSPVIGADGIVYVGSSDRKVYALNGSTGALRWNYTIGSVTQCSPSMGADGTLYVGSNDGIVYALWCVPPPTPSPSHASSIAPSATLSGSVTQSASLSQTHSPSASLSLSASTMPSSTLTSTASPSPSPSMASASPLPNQASGGLQAGAPWPARGYDVAHSGRSPYSMGACPYGVAVRWSYTTGNQVYSSATIGADGTVYVGSLDNKVYALNGSTGTLQWNYTTGDFVHSLAAIGVDGAVYVGSQDKKVYSLNGSTGTLRWDYTTDNQVLSSAAIGADGTVYVGSLDNKVYAFNGSTGALRWYYTTGYGVSSAPALGADGTVYVGSADYKVYAFNGSTGALRWSYTTDDWVYSSPAVGADGTVYVGSYDHKVYAFNGSTGALQWNYTTGDWIYSSPAIGTDGTVYVGSHDNKVYAFNGSTGALRWHYTTGNWVHSSPAIGADGTVYVGSHDNKVYALNGSTGALRWNYTTGNWVHSSPAIGADGTVYVGSLDNNVYALWCAPPPPTPTPSQSPSGAASGSPPASPSPPMIPASPLPNQARGGLQAGAPWPARGHDVGHSGRSPYSMGACPYGVEQRWNYTTGGQVQSSAAVGADGTVYVSSFDNDVYALNGSTGTLRWRYSVGSYVYSSPAVRVGEIILVGSGGGKLYALNANTGAFQWTYTAGHSVDSSPTISADGTVYVGSYDYNVYALNGSTGALRWSFRTGSNVWSSPAIGADGTVYVGSQDYNIYALNGSTGTVRWNFSTSGGVFSSPAIGADGTVYAGSEDGNLYALSGTTGTLRWNYATGNCVQSSPAIASDGTVYVGSYDSKVYALNGSTGALRWSYATAGQIEASPAIGADGTVYVGSFDSIIYALDGSTGALQWSFTTGNTLRSSVSIGADGTIFLGSDDFNVYALWCVPPPPPSPPSLPSASFTVSPTPFLLLSPSVSFSASAAPPSSLATATPSPTPSTSATASVIPPSVLSSKSPSSSGFLTQSVSRSSSMSGSSSASAIATPIFPSSMSASITLMPTASVFPTPLAIAAMLQPLLVRSKNTMITPHSPVVPWLVADSMPASYANLTVWHCRAPCYASCNVSSVVAAVVRPSVLSLPACDATQVSVSIPVWAQFGLCPFSTSGASSAELECQVHSSSPPFDPSAIAHVPIECLPTRWPLLADAVLLLSFASDLSDVVLKSAWGAAVNVTTQLQDGTLPSLAAAVSHISLQAQAVDAAGATALESLQSFMLPVSDKSRVVLVSRRQADSGAVSPPFDNATTVKLNDVVVPAIRLSNDDDIGNISLLVIELPPQTTLCPSLPATEDCGYLQLTITTNDVIDAATNSTVSLGATLSCPPFCPNDFPGTVPFAVRQDSDGNGPRSTTFMPATPQADNAGPPVPISLSALPSTGLYMTSKCIASSFTDPLSGACTNSSDVRHTQCAFGSGTNCVQCPANALCPGGYRAWPRAGYYTAAESSGTILSCPPPAFQRCLGWNASASASQCGQAYLQGSFTCAACARNYYPAPVDGMCTPCPNNGKPSALQILQPIAILAAAILAICGCMYAGITAIAKLRHADTSTLAKRTLQLGVWMWITLQNVAQIGQAASPGLPPIVVSMYEQLAVLQFQGIAVPSVCVGGVPFLNEIVVMAAVLVGMLILASIAWRVKVMVSSASGKRGRLLAASYKLAVIGLTVVYPTATNTVLGVLMCGQADISAATYATLSGDYSLVAAGGRSARSAVQVDVMLSDPSVLCYRTSHVPVAAVAWIVLLVYCIGFPAAVVVVVARRLRTLRGASAATPLTQGPTPSSSQSIVTACMSCNRCRNQAGFEQLGAGSLAKTTAHNSVQTTASSSMGVCCTPRSQDQQHENATDKDSVIATDKLLAPFVAGDYRPSKYWFLAVDRSQFAALAVLQTACRHTIGLAPVQLAGSVAVFAFAAGMLLRYQPYARVARWKGYVRLYTYALCAVAACLNYTTLTASTDSILPLAYICFVGSLVLIVVLVATFIYETLIHMPQPKHVTKRVSVTGTRESQVAWAAQNPLHVKSAVTSPDGARKSVDFHDGSENPQLPAAGARLSARPSGVLARAARNSVAPFMPTQSRRKAVR